MKLGDTFIWEDELNWLTEEQHQNNHLDIFRQLWKSWNKDRLPHKHYIIKYWQIKNTVFEVVLRNANQKVSLGNNIEFDYRFNKKFDHTPQMSLVVSFSQYVFEIGFYNIHHAS